MTTLSMKRDYAHFRAGRDMGVRTVPDSMNRWAAGLWQPTLDVVWQATVVSLLCAIGLPLLRKRTPNLRHALVMLALIKYVTPPVLASPTSLFALLPAWIHPARYTQFANASGDNEHAAWLLVYWAAGIAALAVYVTADWLVLRTGLREAHDVTDAAAIQALRSASSAVALRRGPRLLASDRLAAPQRYGLLKTRLALPAWALRLPQHDVDALIAHEIAHINRHDLAWERLTRLIQLVWWWNPVVWWLCSRARHERELAADDVVVSMRLVEPAWYTSTLVDVAERVGGQDFTSEWLGLRERFHPLKHRILRALDGEAARIMRPGLRRVMLLVLVAAVVLPSPPRRDEPLASPDRTYRYPPVAMHNALQISGNLAKIDFPGSLYDDGANSLHQMPASQSRR